MLLIPQNQTSQDDWQERGKTNKSQWLRTGRNEDTPLHPYRWCSCPLYTCKQMQPLWAAKLHYAWWHFSFDVSRVLETKPATGRSCANKTRATSKSCFPLPFRNHEKKNLQYILPQPTSKSASHTFECSCLFCNPPVFFCLPSSLNSSSIGNNTGLPCASFIPPHTVAW